MIIWSRPGVSPDPQDMLWQYANAAMPFWVSGERTGQLGWVKCTHRGVLRLEKLHIGKTQRREIFANNFEFSLDRAFEEVLRACADLSREGYTWLSEELIQGYCKLHQMGFAHSFEIWERDKLVGGAFGVQLGSLMTLESIFHRADNAGKAATVRMMLHLRDRGFELIDVNFVSDHLSRWGAEWVAQWKFEEELREAMRSWPSVADDRPAPVLPWRVRVGD